MFLLPHSGTAQQAEGHDLILLPRVSNDSLCLLHTCFEFRRFSDSTDFLIQLRDALGASLASDTNDPPVFTFKADECLLVEFLMQAELLVIKRTHQEITNDG